MEAETYHLFRAGKTLATLRRPPVLITLLTIVQSGSFYDMPCNWNISAIRKINYQKLLNETDCDKVSMPTNPWQRGTIQSFLEVLRPVPPFYRWYLHAGTACGVI